MHLTRHTHPRDARGVRRGGYTLVELLVTLTLLGVVGSAVAQIMMGQQRFYQRMTEQMAVRRELRSSLNILPTELRGISSVGGDITAFSTSSLTFRSPVGSAVICARGSATSIDLLPLSTSHAKTTNWIVNPVVGDTVFAYRTDSLGKKGDFWSAHRVDNIGTAKSYCAGSPFLDAVADAEKLRYRLVVSPALPDSVVAGSVLRFARTAKFVLAAQPSGRYYLSRSEYSDGAWSTPIPVSGPFTGPTIGGGGFALALYDSTGAAVSTIAKASGVSRLDIVLRAQGRSGSGMSGNKNTTVIDSLVMRVALKNRR